jgi:hypothetical protein
MSVLCSAVVTLFILQAHILGTQQYSTPDLYSWPTGGNQFVTEHFGPSEEDGSSVWEWEFYSGRHPMSKRTWDIGVMKVIKGR